MQTIQVIQTIAWLNKVIPEETMLQLRAFSNREGSPEKIATYIQISTRIAAAIPQIKAHPFAPEVVTSFGMSPLLTLDFCEAFLAHRLTGKSDPGSDKFREVGRRWATMVESAPAYQLLTVPSVVQKEVDFDDILTLEILTAHEAPPALPDIDKLLKAASKLYQTVAEAQKRKDAGELSVVFITSGSGFRFDLKGLGEIIKQVKELIIAVWEKIRHSKAETFSRKAKAAMEGIGVLEKIGASKQLPVETQNRLAHNIEQSILDMFRVGALPREVRAQETVSNVQLLEYQQQKLLPAPADSKADSKDEQPKTGKKQPPHRRKLKVIKSEPLLEPVPLATRRKLDLSPEDDDSDAES